MKKSVFTVIGVLWCTGIPREGNGTNQGRRVHRGLEQRFPANVYGVARRHFLGADGGCTLRYASCC